METHNSTIEFCNKWLNECEKPKDERDPEIDICGFRSTKADIDDLFKQYDSTVTRYPKDYRLDDNMTIYRNNDPDRWIRVRIRDYIKNPNKVYPKDYNEMKKHGLYKPKNISPAESQRIEKENKLRESMKAEGCELVSKYVKANVKVFYLFNGFEYQTTPTKWNSGYRAHKSKCSHYTQNYIKKAFADEGCELISEFKNVKTLLRYRYQGKIYEVTFDNWKNYGRRPHKYCEPVSEA